MTAFWTLYCLPALKEKPCPKERSLPAGKPPENAGVTNEYIFTRAVYLCAVSVAKSNTLIYL